MPAYYVRVAWRSTNTASGALVVNVHHLEVDWLTDPPNYTTMANDVATGMQTQYLNVLSALETLHDITVTQENQPNVAPGQGIHNVNLPGNRTSSTTNCSPALCAVLQLKTATPKRYGRGRLFMPPVHDAGQLANNSTWAPAGTYWTAVNALAVVLQNGFTSSAAAYKSIIYSRTREKGGFTPYVFPVTQAVPSPTQYWQRRRITAP